MNKSGYVFLHTFRTKPNNICRADAEIWKGSKFVRCDCLMCKFEILYILLNKLKTECKHGILRNNNEYQPIVIY